MNKLPDAGIEEQRWAAAVEAAGSSFECAGFAWLLPGKVTQQPRSRAVTRAVGGGRRSGLDGVTEGQGEPAGCHTSPFREIACVET